MTTKAPLRVFFIVDGYTLKKANDYYRLYHPCHTPLDFRAIKNWARKEALRLSALEHFWNGWATTRKDIVLIVCGSATSWIIEKIINNHGGLHNRLTKRILLQPFTLKECEEFAQSHGLGMSRMQMMEAYMIMGGIPYYWNFLQKGQSLAQNIDRLFFNKEGELKDEFDMLYASLFKSPENYIKVITALGEKKAGMTREEIISQTSMSDSGTLTKILKELEWCGFIRKYNVLGKKVKSAIYQLIDNYTLFYFRFIRRNENNDENFWSSSINSSLYHNWCGLSFERQSVSLCNLRQELRGRQGNDHSVLLHETDLCRELHVGEHAAGILAEEAHRFAGFELMFHVESQN